MELFLLLVALLIVAGFRAFNGRLPQFSRLLEKGEESECGKEMKYTPKSSVGKLVRRDHVVIYVCVEQNVRLCREM